MAHLARNDKSLEEVSVSELEKRFPDFRQKTNGNLLAFARNASGRFHAILGEVPDYLSNRVGLGDLSWNPRREARIIPLSVKSGATTISREIDGLPTPLRTLLKSGKYLETSSKTESDWSLLMSAGNQDSGRTGILLYKGRPLLLRERASGQELLVETKGAGSPSGGKTMDERYLFKGGLWEADGERELEILRNLEASPDYWEPGGLRPGGLVTIPNGLPPQGKYNLRPNPQAILFRLVPGSLRLTFTGNPSFPKKELTSVATQMGQQWGKLLKRGLVPLSHPENLIWDPGTHHLQNTDFSDVYHFTQFPLEEFGSPRSLADGVITTLDSRKEVNEYGIAPNDFDRHFFQGLSLELRSKPEPFKNSKEVYDYLIRNRYGLRLFQERRPFPPSYEERLLQTPVPDSTIRDYLERAQFKQTWFDRDDRTQGLGAVCENLETELKRSTGPDSEAKRKILTELKAAFDLDGQTLDGKLQALQRVELGWKQKYPDLVFALLRPLNDWAGETAQMIKREEEQLKVLELLQDPEARQHVAQRHEEIRKYQQSLSREGVTGMLRRSLKGH